MKKLFGISRYMLVMVAFVLLTGLWIAGTTSAQYSHVVGDSCDNSDFDGCGDDLYCVAVGSSSSPTCQECLKDDDCLTGFVCENNICNVDVIDIEEEKDEEQEEEFQCDSYEDFDSCYLNGIENSATYCCGCGYDGQPSDICSCSADGKLAKIKNSCSDNYGPQYRDDGNCCITICDKTVTRREVSVGYTCASKYGDGYSMDDNGCCLPNPSTTCSKGSITNDTQDCCEGYTEVKDDSGEKQCKECGKDGVCCGVKLNTKVPFIGDCIQFQRSASDPDTTVVGPTTAFPKLMQGLSKLMVTAILVFSFVLLIVAGVMMTAGGADKNAYSSGKDIIVKVIMGIALLGASGILLKLINPNFFG